MIFDQILKNETKHNSSYGDMVSFGKQSGLACLAFQKATISKHFSSIWTERALYRPEIYTLMGL